MVQSVKTQFTQRNLSSTIVWHDRFMSKCSGKEGRSMVGGHRKSVMVTESGLGLRAVWPGQITCKCGTRRQIASTQDSAPNPSRTRAT